MRPAEVPTRCQSTLRGSEEYLFGLDFLELVDEAAVHVGFSRTMLIDLGNEAMISFSNSVHACPHLIPIDYPDTMKP